MIFSTKLRTVIAKKDACNAPRPSVSSMLFEAVIQCEAVIEVSASIAAYHFTATSFQKTCSSGIIPPKCQSRAGGVGRTRRPRTWLLADRLEEAGATRQWSYFAGLAHHSGRRLQNVTEGARGHSYLSTCSFTQQWVQQLLTVPILSVPGTTRFGSVSFGCTRFICASPEE